LPFFAVAGIVKTIWDSVASSSKATSVKVETTE
jgi:hypothetical protein